MLLTNQGAAVERNITQYKRMLKEWNCTKRKKGKFLNALECGSTRLVQYSNLAMHHGCMVTWYESEYKYPYTPISERFFPPSTSHFSQAKLFHFLIIIILEFNPNSKIILRQSQNLSQPNFLIASTKLF